MQLPEDSKARTKVLLAIACGVIVAIYGVVQGILTLQSKHAHLAEELLDLEWKVSSSGRDVISAEGYRPKNLATLSAIMETSDDYLLHSILGNYRLGASKILEAHAAHLNIELPSVQEVGILDLPKPKDKKLGNTFKAYVVRVALECSYFDAIRFIRTLESDNPYLSIVGISIAAQSDKNPERHRIVLSIQWPIWANEETEKRIGDRLVAERERE